jgi:4-hydroxy-3-methylbut-2-enyl diphosphate reductase
MKIILANPRGFCAGVNMAIECVDEVLRTRGGPVYVYHEIVHNKHVVEGFQSRDVVFVNHIAEVPQGGLVVYSAHGISPEIRRQARERKLIEVDATCPLVTKVHMEVAKMRREGREIVMIGHEGHPEVEGTMGQTNDGMHLVETVADVERLQVGNPDMLAYVSQTTLSVDDTADVIAALKQKFPSITEPKKGDICYATTNRQQAVKFMAPQVDMVIVVGSPNSSNSNRLREVAEKKGTVAYMVDNAEQIDQAWLQGKNRIGVTAGASAPEILVQAVIDRLKACGAKNVRTLDGAEENVTFPMPKGLARV